MRSQALLIVLASAALLVPVQRWLEAQPRPALPIDDAPYGQTGRSLRGMQLGFHSLLADVYWLRAIQYVGGKIQTAPANAPMRQWGLEALLPLLNVVTELDPNYVAAYRFGATFLPEVELGEAVAFVERGIRANPEVWQLYLDLGYLHWQRQNYHAARDAYLRGSHATNAPVWLTELAGAMALQGSDRQTARAIFRRLLETSTDDYSRDIALLNLQALQAQDELTVWNRLLNREPARCASSAWMPMAASEANPLQDPTGFAYKLDNQHCRIVVSEASPLVRWMPRSIILKSHE